MEPQVFGGRVGDSAPAPLRAGQVDEGTRPHAKKNLSEMTFEKHLLAFASGRSVMTSQSSVHGLVALDPRLTEQGHGPALCS